MRAPRIGTIGLGDPAVTVALLSRNALVGVTGFPDGRGGLRSIGNECALCNSTVDDPLRFPIAARNGEGHVRNDADLVAPELAPLHRDQLALQASPCPAGASSGRQPSEDACPHNEEAIPDDSADGAVDPPSPRSVPRRTFCDARRDPRPRPRPVPSTEKNHLAEYLSSERAALPVCDVNDCHNARTASAVSVQALTS